MRSTARPVLIALAVPILLALACNQPPVADIGLPQAGGGLPVTVFVPAGVDPADLQIALDGSDVRSLFTAGPTGLVATLPLPAPGAHELLVTRPVAPLGTVGRKKAFDVPAPAPTLTSVAPAGSIPVTAWLRFQFASDVDASMLAGFGFAISCNGQVVQRLAYTVASRSVVLDPSVDLPAGPCRVVWRDATGATERSFTVAARAATAPASAVYDRDDPAQLSPLPDDWWTGDDPTSPTGVRLFFTAPEFGDLRDSVIGGIAQSIADLDGWSPVNPIVLSFSHPVDRSQLPADEFAAQDPFSPLCLFDADPASPDYGARVPFLVEARDDPAPDGTTDHSLILFPSIMLRPQGRYAVVVTQRLFAAGDPTRPIGRSAFFDRVVAPPTPDTTGAEGFIRDAVDPLLDFLETVPAVPIQRGDVALVVRITTRSYLRDPSDMVAIKENALAAPPPPLTVTSITSSAQRRLIVRGTLALPTYLGDPDASILTRDATGRPQSLGTENVPFTMTLPNQALTGPVPIVIFQHGSPGSQEDVLSSNNEFLDDAGYAILGIQDTTNRRYGADSTAQTVGVLFHLINYGHIPLLELQTHADLQALLRAIVGIAAHDWLPNGAPDGVLELDPSRIVYRGVSFGSHHSLGFLPFAPEVRASASVVGAGRFYENSIHQIDHYDVLTQIHAFLPALRPIELLVGLAALQNDEDRQDPHFLARYLYRERLPIAGIPASAPPPSLLWLEGIGDTVVSNNATRAAARELGIPQVERVKRASPGLDRVAAPLAGNMVGGTRTAGHFQYDPPNTPSCVASATLEGHFCPQRATEARTQILQFFSGALSGAAPTIVDPLP
jgi:hypothetical protein